MIFAILGIVVLIVSFVIALVTLVREQGRLDEVGGLEAEGDKSEVDAALSAKDPSAGKFHPQSEVSKQEFDLLSESGVVESSPHYAPLGVGALSDSSARVQGADAGLESAAAVGMPGEKKSHVWWEKLDENGDRQEEKNEDEESIEKIREELAKLMSTKTNVKEEEGLAVESHHTLTQSGLGTTTLAGEFSLREIKKKD